MLKTQSKKVEHVGFSCPWCGKWHRVRLYEFEASKEPDPFGDFISGPPGNRLTCKCGADLLVLGDPEDFDVMWCNKKEIIGAAWLRTRPYLRPGQGLYYDLIRVPHGHIPAGKVFLWKRFPLLVREIRGDKYFKCPECGEPSFFKNTCRDCVYVCTYDVNWLAQRAFLRRRQVRARRDYFRNLLKDLEKLVLPVLVLLGKAWYVRSERRHWKDGYVGYGRRRYE